ncbi:MAG: right-handed parallel beta-helix repeat-containing protein [Kofleriaceae bacterium]
MSERRRGGVRTSWTIVVAAAASGCGGGGGQPPGGGDAGAPPAVCAAPAPVDVSNPTTVVGDGAAASCTAAALRAAVAAGGVVTFACGAQPVTIAIDDTVVATVDTVVDGGGLITLDGGGQRRILLLDSGYDVATPRLVVQGLRFWRGQAPAVGDDTAQGGGAIYRDGGSLTVIDSIFDDNGAPGAGQDVAGGAIYAFGGGDTLVVGSTFTGNHASNGGAIGSLNGDLTIVNSTFTDNAATGTGGNPGDGGCGGALYQDGRDEITSLCGVTITGSTAGAIGGAVFRVSNDDTGTFSMERSTVDDNRVVAEGGGNAGGMYLQGLALRLERSTISRNQAFYGGGLWINAGSAELTNLTIAGNVATGSNGGGVWLGNDPVGTMRNCTIADNHATAANQIAGGIFGAGLTLTNTIVADNTAMYTPTCDVERARAAAATCSGRRGRRAPTPRWWPIHGWGARAGRRRRAGDGARGR